VKRRRVYVSGVGAITPLGGTWADSLEPLARGRSAVAPVESFDVSSFPCTVAARIPREFDHTNDRRLALAQEAAREAWSMARVDAAPERIAVFIGAESGRATVSTILELARAAGGGTSFDHHAFGTQARTLAARIDASTVSPAAVASELAREFRAHGSVQTISIACASGAAAIVEGARAVRLGLCDVALCGGVGADVDPLMLVGFGRLGALSARGVSCPFDVRRDGFVVGEGAAMVVLSSRPSSTLNVEVSGIARTLDAYHLTKPDPEGDGAVRAMRGALADAARDSVDCIQAHGTSTPLNDEVEAKAIRRVFGARSREIHVSSVKGAVGHWVAGAGAIGFLCAAHAVSSGIVLPTANLKEPDPRCELRHVQGNALSADISSALVNAFAFGGANACLVVERVT
jgi:3-oxoacyl-[acyl-carrier-protein] synthase II